MEMRARQTMIEVEKVAEGEMLFSQPPSKLLLCITRHFAETSSLRDALRTYTSRWTMGSKTVEIGMNAKGEGTGLNMALPLSTTLRRAYGVTHLDNVLRRCDCGEAQSLGGATPEANADRDNTLHQTVRTATGRES